MSSSSGTSHPIRSRVAASPCAPTGSSASQRPPTGTATSISTGPPTWRSCRDALRRCMSSRSSTVAPSRAPIPRTRAPVGSDGSDASSVRSVPGAVITTTRSPTVGVEAGSPTRTDVPVSRRTRADRTSSATPVTTPGTGCASRLNSRTARSSCTHQPVATSATRRHPAAARLGSPAPRDDKVSHHRPVRRNRCRGRPRACDHALARGPHGVRQGEQREDQGDGRPDGPTALGGRGEHADGAERRPPDGLVRPHHQQRDRGDHDSLAERCQDPPRRRDLGEGRRSFAGDGQDDRGTDEDRGDDRQDAAGEPHRPGAAISRRRSRTACGVVHGTERRARAPPGHGRVSVARSQPTASTVSGSW